MGDKARTLDLKGTEVTFVTFLHHGSGGLTSIYQDDKQNKYVLKSTLGEDATDEAALNQRLNRLHDHKKDTAGEHLLLTYVEGEDVDRAIAKYLGDPPIDEIGCANFLPSYLTKPFGGFETGLDRNITLAIKLIQAQIALVKQGIVHVDIQLANYVMRESEQNIIVEGIDFGTAIDFTTVSEREKKLILKDNIDSIIEALKAILTKAAFMKMIEQLKPNGSYHDITAALEQQRSPKPLYAKQYIPSYVSESSQMNTPLPERVINKRHLEFVQRRLESSIRKNDIAAANSYLLHGAKLDEKMVEELKKKGAEVMLTAIKPYIDEYESEQLINSMQGLNIKRKLE
jgi:hypothetical protein